MDNAFRLDDRRFLVTGASSGIGRACCVAIAEGGGKVLASGRDHHRLQETLAALPGEGHDAFLADLTLEPERDELLGTVGELGGAVFAAGISELRPVKFLDAALVRRLHEINVEAPLAIMAGLVQQGCFGSGASVIFLSSVAAQIGSPGLTAYAATKGALLGAVKSLAVELARRKVRVNAISPAMVRTRMAQDNRERLSAAAQEADEQRYPLGYGDPEDVALAARYLLSPAARWVTGTNLVLDGGFTAQ